MVLKDAISVYGKVNKIPDMIEESVNTMKIGDTLKVKDLSINSALDIDERDSTVIAVCQPPMKVEAVKTIEVPISLPKVSMAGA